MKVWTAITLGLAVLLVATHADVLWRAYSPQRDPNGYEQMVLFFYGLPLAVVVVITAMVALKTTKKKRFRVPLAVGSLPIVPWPTMLVLELLRVVP